MRMRCGKKEEEEEEEVKIWRRRDQVKIYRVAVSHMGDGGAGGAAWLCVALCVSVVSTRKCWVWYCGLGLSHSPQHIRYSGMWVEVMSGCLGFNCQSLGCPIVRTCNLIA